MTVFAATAALILTIAALSCLISAVIITAWRDGSLQADVKWVRLYIRIIRDSKKTIATTN